MAQITIAFLATLFITSLVIAEQTTTDQTQEHIITDVDIDAYLEQFFPNQTRKQDYMRNFLESTNFSVSINAQDDEAFVTGFFEEKLSLYLEPALIAFNKEVQDEFLNTDKTDSLWATISFIIAAIIIVSAFGIGCYYYCKQTNQGRTLNVFWKMPPKPDQSTPESP